KRRVRHQSTKEDGAKQREGRDLGIDARWKVSGRNATGNQLDGRLARLGLKLVMKPAYSAIALRAVDESRKTGREGRVRDDVGDVAQNALEFLTRRGGHKLRVALLLKQLERVGDECDLVRPMPIDRCFADAGATRSGFDRECAVADLAEL